jgi:hypothetical protein
VVTFGYCTCGFITSLSPENLKYPYSLPLAIIASLFMAEYPGWQSASWSSTSRQQGQFSCKTSFELPFPSQKLFLLARGPVGGSVKIIQSPTYRASGMDEGVVMVEVAAIYWHVSDLDFIRVSRISRDGDENGVGIFVSSSLNQSFS